MFDSRMLICPLLKTVTGAAHVISPRARALDFYDLGIPRSTNTTPMGSLKLLFVLFDASSK